MHSRTSVLRRPFWGGCAALVAVAVLFSVASVRSGVEPSPFHGASNRVSLPDGAGAVKPQRALFTMAQPFAGQARAGAGLKQGIDATTSGPGQVGVGFEYLLLERSLCDCDCHADPVCDGVTAVQDVVTTVGTAFRGNPPIIDSGCIHAGRTDVNCDGFSTVIDVVRMVDVAFRGADPGSKFCDPCGM